MCSKSRICYNPEESKDRIFLEEVHWSCPRREEASFVRQSLWEFLSLENLVVRIWFLMLRRCCGWHTFLPWFWSFCIRVLCWGRGGRFYDSFRIWMIGSVDSVKPYTSTWCRRLFFLWGRQTKTILRVNRCKTCISLNS